MIKLYYSNYKFRLEDSCFLNYLKTVPPSIQDKILKYRRWEDSHASLFGKLLLKKALSDYNMDCSLRNLEYTKYGRPFIKGCFDFNISHSGCFVICAFSFHGESIGVDLEEIKKINIFDFKDQFTEEEWQYIINSENNLSAFYYYWTAKEAIIKADGKGLSLPLRQISIKDGKLKLGQDVWYYECVDFQENYILHIAAKEKLFDAIELNEVCF